MLKLEQHEICPLANLWFEMWWRSRSSLVSPSPLSNNKHDQHIGLLCPCPYCTIGPRLNCSVLMCLCARAGTSLWSVSSRPFQAYLAVNTVTLLFFIRSSIEVRGASKYKLRRSLGFCPSQRGGEGSFATIFQNSKKHKLLWNSSKAWGNTHLMNGLNGYLINHCMGLLGPEKIGSAGK